MDSVTNSVLADYQERITNLRASIDTFQYQHDDEIAKLSKLGPLASEADYTALLGKLKKQIDDVRLFAIVDEHGHGVLKHITGDFLPDCKEEIHSTLTSGSQEHLFLHRSKTSIHFDLLEPLSFSEKQGWFFFVAFNTTVFESLLTKYQLPHQELFLLRKDNVGKIELSTTTTKDQSIVGKMTMSAEEVQQFNFLKDIPGTRWQLAIRLAPEYHSSIQFNSIFKALILWLFASGIIYVFYLIQKQRNIRHQAVKRKLAFNATHDALTGLMNRSAFEKALARQTDKAAQQASQEHGVVMLIDIDQFQLINNSFGYAQGDSFLNHLSNQLQAFLPDNIAISRLGNDEFSVLLPELAFNDANSLAEALRLFIEKIEYGSGASSISVTASIGVLNIDGKQNSSEQVLNSLAQAVRIAKDKGRNRVQLYQSNDKALIQHAQEMAVLKDIDSAISDNRLILYRQHINALQGDINRPKYEVLVRLKDDTGNIIPPNLFIPASEKFGLITKVDRWVIQATFEAIAKSQCNGHYSINLSGITLADKDIVEFVKAVFEQYQISPSQIGFEITETYAITHLKSAINFIQTMTDMGCEFSLDDFGSGLSSFSYLQQLPVHHIKIDGCFIRDICDNRLNQVFVETMHKVAQELGKDCIAEFVEDERTEQHLISMGIEFAQGYYHHRPELWFEYNR